MTSDLPTASEILQEYFGETDSFKCVQVWNARRAQTRSFLEEVSDLAIDTSLFPYQAQGPFETPIPTLDEIAAAWALAEKRPGFTPHIEVCRIGPYMVKMGFTRWIFAEAENLLYLERHSDVRTPKVYAAFSSQDADTFNLRKEGDKTRLVYYYLIEEYIEGELLSDVGRELEKPPLVRKIGKLLGEQLQRLRNVPAEDPNHFGRVGGKPYLAISPYYHPPAPDFHDYGPFNYGELVERLIHTGKIERALGFQGEDYTPLTKTIYRDARKTLMDHVELGDRLPVLSHLDTQPHNIIVN